MGGRIGQGKAEEWETKSVRGGKLRRQGWGDNTTKDMEVKCKDEAGR